MAKCVEAAINKVVTPGLKEWRGLHKVSMETWDAFQTALILILVCPFAMAPMRETVLPYLRHPSFFSLPCDHPHCAIKEKCKGCRIELVPGTKKWALRANHHKTDRVVGILKGPIPGGVAALVGLWSYCSQHYTGRMEGVHSLFYSFRTGHQFTEQSLQRHVEVTLIGIFHKAGLPVVTPRGMRHLFAAGFSDYVADKVRDMDQLRFLQARAAELMGTSRNRFKVSP